MHSEPADRDHSDGEQHSGSERGRRDEDEDEEDEARRSGAGSPAGSGMSAEGSPHSEMGSARSERRYAGIVKPNNRKTMRFSRYFDMRQML